jgi:hypothetical protein
MKSLNSWRLGRFSAASAVLTIFIFLAAAPARAQTNFVTLAGDGAWTWFNDPRALFYHGLLYYGYDRDADGECVLSVFNPQTGATTNLWLSSETDQDDHFVPGLLVKQDGTMLAIYTGHQVDQYFTYRLSTTDPSSPANWGPEETNNTETNVGTGMTYSNPFQLSGEGGRIYNFSRYLNYNPNVFTSDDGGNTWSLPQILIQTGLGGIRPYVKYCSDNHKRIDFLYTDGHPDNIPTSLYHLYYQNGAYYQTDGTMVTNGLPIQHDAGFRGWVIYQYSDAFTNDPNQWIPTGRAWCWDIAYQTNGAPFCVFQVKVDNVTGSNWYDRRIYYYYARWTGTNWQKRFIAHAGRPLYDNQPDYGGGICVDAQDPNTIYLSSDAANPFDLCDLTNVPLAANYEIWKGVTTNGGLSFAWQSITGDSTNDNLRPYVPRVYGGPPAVLWFQGTYTTFVQFDTSIVGLVSPPAAPQITNLALTGNQAVFTGSNGTAESPFVLSSATNLSAGNWHPVLTNSFDYEGNFHFAYTNPDTPPHNFFRLELQP